MRTVTASLITVLVLGTGASTLDAAGFWPFFRKSSTSEASQKRIRKKSSRGKAKYDHRMQWAVKIAETCARSRSTRRCWRYVKQALLKANLVESYPGTTYAKSAGVELSRNHGFKKIAVSNPFKAPLGAVLVYGGKGAGHVELRSEDGFVSDFKSPKPSKRPLIGVYVKPVRSGW